LTEKQERESSNAVVRFYKAYNYNATFCLGYSNSLQKYVLVIVIYFLDKNNTPFGSEVIFYYPKSNSHFSLGLFPFNAEVTSPYGQFFHDVLYWLAETANGHSFVVSHDIVTNAYKKVSLPVALNNPFIYTKGCTFSEVVFAYYLVGLRLILNMIFGC